MSLFLCLSMLTREITGAWNYAPLNKQACSKTPTLSILPFLVHRQCRTETIRAREVCCIDSTARDVGCCYNAQLAEAGRRWST